MIWIVLALFAAFLLYQGATLTNIVQAARNAGFSGDDLVTAVAIAYAESGGNRYSYNPESAYFARHNIDGTNLGSYGLWQIFLYAHPEFNDWDLYDPEMNAKAAYSVYQAAGNTFTPWSTFNSGAYTAHLDKATSEVNA